MGKELRLRILSALVLAIGLYFYLFHTPKTYFIIVTMGILFIGVYEYGSGLKKKLNHRFLELYSTSILFFLSLIYLWMGLDQQAAIFAGLTLGLLVLFSAFRKSDWLKFLLWFLFPLLWIGVAFVCFVLLRFLDDSLLGAMLMVYLLLAVASNDIFAYFGGKNFGKRLLAPAISPKKTIEGSLSGIVGGMAVGLVFCYLTFENIQWTYLAILTLVLIIVSQIGDLIESKFKRYCGIKDSSNIIPGHGGLLDRIDAYLLSVPLLWLSIRVFGIPFHF